MATNYKAYPAYKDSGVEWLGEVPESWAVTQIKYGFNITLGKMLTKIPKDNSYKLKPYLKAINIQLNGINISSIDNMWFSPSELKNLRLKKNDLLISEGGDVGRCAIWKNEIPECYIQNAINRVRPKNLNSSLFLFYWMNYLKSSGFIDILCNKATIAHYTAEKVETSLLLLPPITEQQKIADFLDYETTKIDTLINKQETLIELLKEKRQAVISHAVTKGLDPNVPMKDSGVEWLGEIPEHWDVSKLNYLLLQIGDIDHYMPSSIEEGIPYLMTGDLKPFVSNINFKDCKKVSTSDYKKLSRKILTTRGDIIMARYASIGNVSYVDINKDFLVSYSCVTIKPNNKKILGLYLYYYFKSDTFLRSIKNNINTNTQDNVGVSDLRNIKIIYPNINEQKKLINYLDYKTAKIDLLISKAEQAIELIKERKTALISAAVTGKIDVRDWGKP